MSTRHALMLLGFLTAAIPMAGCGEEAPIELSYVRPATYPIPEKIKRVAVAEFKSTTPDPVWGGIASDKLASELDKVNREFNRYQLVDRRNLAKVMHEKDLQIMNSDTAVQAGKLADVQAMLYGTVAVKVTDERASRMVLDPFSQSMKEKYYTKRNCYVSVNITMTDVDTAATLHTFTLSKTFDSDKDAKGSALGKVMGFNSDNPPAASDTVNQLLDVVVADFIQQISPHRQVISERLESGKGPAVDKGNKLAKEKEYADALDQYRKAIKEHPDDDGAFFNAGLMCEALGDFDGAGDYYSKAVQMGDKEKYIKARKRVRAESAKPEPSKAAGKDKN